MDEKIKKEAFLFLLSVGLSKDSEGNLLRTGFEELPALCFVFSSRDIHTEEFTFYRKFHNIQMCCNPNQKKEALTFFMKLNFKCPKSFGSNRNIFF